MVDAVRVISSIEPSLNAIGTPLRTATATDSASASEAGGVAAKRPARSADEVSLSDEAREASSEEAGAPVGRDGEPLSEQEQEQVERLEDRDAEVRAHELAHKAAAGPYATGGPTYSYETGPDGKRYAVGGSVQIDVSPVKGDPEATIRKMAVVRRAALAPKEPSAQDRRVAAQADRTASQARAELNQSMQSEIDESASPPREVSSALQPDNARTIDVYA